MRNVIAAKIESFMNAGSWIRKMFEEGIVLKQQYGAANVFDFSLGNPMGEPPEAFQNAMKTVIEDRSPGIHSYMPNAGYPHVRKALAEVIQEEQQVDITGAHLIMTVGAAGALNVTLKALIDPGDVVLIFAPYFVGYKFYIDNVSGQCRVVETDENFNLDIEAISRAMDASVKALIINTPNNPTGRVYPESILKKLSDLVEAKIVEYGHPIYILSDEPYKKIVYDGVTVPSLLKISPHSLICTSYSKELAIPGERLGYIAVNPACPESDKIIDALTFCNRILGFVNAPALMQRALALASNAVVDITGYATNRKRLLEALTAMGYEICSPEGAFYLFPKSPIEDERIFVEKLKSERILAVPGRGFGRAGYFRLAYCVTPEIIEGALPGFERAIRDL